MWWLLGTVAWAASCGCEAELDFVVEKLRRTPSYREQIRGPQRAVFDSEVAALRAELAADPLVALHCRAYLQRAMALVRDRHLSVGSSSASRALPPRPRYDGEVPVAALEQAAPGELAGIYVDGDSRLAVFSPEAGAWLGVMLVPPGAGWAPGDVLLSLSEAGDHVEALVYAGEALYLEERTADRVLSRLPYRREGAAPAHRGPDGPARYTALGDGVGYLRLPSFSGRSENLAEVRALYAEAAPQLAALSDLIIDVRDNTGGGEVAYNPLLDAIDDNEALRLHVLVNRHTASAAEHFSLGLQQQGATLYGENTRGALRYRYANRDRSRAGVQTPCYGYPLGLSVARVRGPTADPDLEVVGITPDVSLLGSADWLTAVQTSLAPEIR